ncbi:MAG: hypothetical protein ACE5I7_20015 [Candidatus Binatia bacterium]
MKTAAPAASEQANDTRYHPGSQAGHYESFFVRANHPSRPLAFWIRYTIFSPRRHPEAALGELWAVYFDGETGRHVAAKREMPYTQCVFTSSPFLARIGTAVLESGRLQGDAESGPHTLSWDLSFRGSAPPLFLLPLRLYDARLPKAKSLVSLPFATFAGSLRVDGRTIDVTEWVGSQNHNWGSQHTDHYAWGQVAGFDTHPESFLEVATARLRIGPLWTPFMTTLVLRHRGQECALNGLRQALRASASFTYFTWHFRSESDALMVEGSIDAAPAAFVGLRYANPPGGIKHCLNTKIATCKLQVTDKRARRAVPPEVLSTKHRAAFEILTDDRGHGVSMRG